MLEKVALTSPVSETGATFLISITLLEGWPTFTKVILKITNGASASSFFEIIEAEVLFPSGVMKFILKFETVSNCEDEFVETVEPTGLLLESLLFQHPDDVKIKLARKNR